MQLSSIVEKKKSTVSSLKDDLEDSKEKKKWFILNIIHLFMEKIPITNRSLNFILSILFSFRVGVYTCTNNSDLLALPTRFSYLRTKLSRVATLPFKQNTASFVWS